MFSKSSKQVQIANENRTFTFLLFIYLLQCFNSYLQVANAKLINYELIFDRV